MRLRDGFVAVHHATAVCNDTIVMTHANYYGVYNMLLTASFNRCSRQLRGKILMLCKIQSMGFKSAVTSPARCTGSLEDSSHLYI